MNIAGHKYEEGKTLEVDGIYGAKTANTVMGYQRANGIPSHGVMDDITWDYMHDDIKRNNYIVPITPIGRYTPRGNAGIVTAYNYEGTSAKTGNTAGTTGTGSYKDNFNGGNSIKPVEIPEAVELYADSPWNESVMEKAEISKEIKEKYYANGVIRPGYNKGGIWSENPDADNYGENSPKYQMISKLDNMCRSTNSENKAAIKEFTDNFRIFDADSICKAYYLNDEDGASGFGHTGLLLVDKNGRGVLFSYGAGTSNFFYGDARMYMGAYDSNEVEWLLKNQYSFVINKRGEWLSEQYDRWKDFSVSPKNGYKIFENAIDATVNLEKYAVLWNNCDQMVIEAFGAGGINIEEYLIPNNTFENIS